MALRDQPYFPLYVQDYLTDEKLNNCSAATQGVYIKILCVLHKQTSYGQLLFKQTSKQKFSSTEYFARILSNQLTFDYEVILPALIELVEEDVLQIDGEKLSQKRMIKDFMTSKQRSEAGKKGGGNPNLFKQTPKHQFKQKPKQNTEYENEYENEYELELIIKECLKKIKLENNDSREFHNAIYNCLKDEYKMTCHYEFSVPQGRVDIVVDFNGEKYGIELDYRLPRSKSIMKLKSNFKSYFILIRDPKINHDYSVFQNCLLYENGFTNSHASETEILEHPYLEKIKKEFPVLLKMKQPLTEKEAERLEQELGDEVVHEKLEAMANKADILKKYTSTNLTIRSWVKYSKNNGKSITGTKPEKKFGRISEGILTEFVNRGPIAPLTGEGGY